MIRFVLVIAAGLLVADVAYAAGPNTCMKSCNDITANVCNLKLPYVPGSKKSPQCAAIKGNDRAAKRRLATAAGAIQKAFAIAPAGLQQCLCSLKQIFVTTDSTYGSWGKWEGRGNGNSSIAVYNPVLNATLPALLNQGLTGLGISNADGQYTDNNYANSGTIAVLYALAHEMGHMAFRRDYTSLNGCTLQSFLSASWMDAAQNWSTWVKRPWTYYGEDDFGQRDNGIPDPINASANELKTIYQSPVVTALAAANPEEDFVEAYAVEAINLATAGNNYTLSIVIPAAGGTPYAVNQGRSSLNPKFTCVDSLLKYPP